MEIKVLLFGPQAQLAGTREVTLSVEPPTAGGVLNTLANEENSLAASLPVSRLAVNHEFVDEDHPIHPGDEVALIGMVSGG